MRCTRCGARPSDPDAGADAWRRAVQADQQVLICPDCQQDEQWRSDVDTCARCGSPDLLRSLGRTMCSRCGAGNAAVPAQRDPAEPEVIPADSEDDALAQDVATAINRVLGRSAGR